MDTAFEEVIHACSAVERKGQEGTWITPEMEQAYIDLHHKGYAHSVETFHKGKLVGGLYGVSLGAIFFGESMFQEMKDASKVALFHLVQQLRQWDFDFIDVQIPSDHMKKLGAKEIPRNEFLKMLEQGLGKPTRKGYWGEEVREEG